MGLECLHSIPSIQIALVLSVLFLFSLCLGTLPPSSTLTTLWSSVGIALYVCSLCHLEIVPLRTAVCSSSPLKWHGCSSTVVAGCCSHSHLSSAALDSHSTSFLIFNGKLIGILIRKGDVYSKSLFLYLNRTFNHLSLFYLSFVVIFNQQSNLKITHIS